MASGREEYFQQTFASPLGPGQGVDRDKPGEGRAVYDHALEPQEGRETVWAPPRPIPPRKPPQKPTEVSSGAYEDWTQLRFKLWPVEELGPEPPGLIQPSPRGRKPPVAKKPPPEPVRIVPRSPRPRG